MNIYTSENEMLKEELKAANAWIKASEKIIAEQDAKLKLALYRAVKTYHEGEPVYVAQPEQPKYRRGSRVICLETEEYCVIHISGTDRQWVKFPDSHIGVYTNEQVAELFELLPKEQPQPEQNLNCKSTQARLATAWGYVKAQPEQESFEYWNAVEGWVKIDEVRKHFDSVGCGTIYKTAGEDRTPLYTTLPRRPWVGLTYKEKHEIRYSHMTSAEFIEFIEAKLKEKNT